VVADPVEGRRGENGIHGMQWQRTGEIGAHEADALAERCQSALGLDEHGGGAIKGDHRPARQSLAELGRDPPGTTARIEHTFLLVSSMNRAHEMSHLPADTALSPSPPDRRRPLTWAAGKGDRGSRTIDTGGL